MPNDARSLARIVVDALDDRIDDATFRLHARHAAWELIGALEQIRALSGSPQLLPSAATDRQPGAARYKYVSVPNGRGGKTSVSISSDLFEQLAAALGGPTQVMALARRLALSHSLGSNVSRSAYVRRRLQQRAAKLVRADPGEAGDVSGSTSDDLAVSPS